MTAKQAEKVLEMHRTGHCIRMASGPYIHDFAQLDTDGVTWTIANNVLSERPLSEVSFYDLSFFKHIEVEG